MKKLLSVFLIMFMVSCGIAYADNYYGYYIEAQCAGELEEPNCVEDIHSFINTIVVIWLHYQYANDFKQLRDAKDHGLNYIIDTTYIFTKSENEWEGYLIEFQEKLIGDPGDPEDDLEPLAILVIDEPGLRGFDSEELNAAVNLTKQYFPNTKTVVPFFGSELDPPDNLD